MRARGWLLLSLGTLLLPALGTAQTDAARARREAVRAERQAAREERPGSQGPADPVARRALLENRLREALGQVVRQRLNLDDAQATRLMAVNQRFNDERMRLFREELRLRRDLRRTMAAGGAENSPQTAQLLDNLLDIQRQRVETQQKEQQALAEFLTPEQRARYLAMMEELRRRVQARLAESAPPSATPPPD